MHDERGFTVRFHADLLRNDTSWSSFVHEDESAWIHNKRMRDGAAPTEDRNLPLAEFSLEGLQIADCSYLVGSHPMASRLFANLTATVFVNSGYCEFIAQSRQGKGMQINPDKSSCFIHWQLPSPALVSSMACQAGLFQTIDVQVKLPISDEEIQKMAKLSVINLDVSAVAVKFLQGAA